MMITNLDDLTRALITIIFDYRKIYRPQNKILDETEVEETIYDTAYDVSYAVILTEAEKIAQRNE